MITSPTSGVALIRAEHLGRVVYQKIANQKIVNQKITGQTTKDQKTKDQKTKDQKTKDQKILVDDANFEVQSGEILAIVGPSGSGKSSLLRLLNRLDEPTSGTVYVEGIDYRQIVPRELRRKLGMVTQRPFLFPGTVAANLRFGPEQRGESLSDDVIEQLLDEVGLEGYGARDVANLSGGEAQRVSFARTLANTPLLLLLDEPTSALDDASKSGVEALVLKIVQKQKLTCVLVTHDTPQASRLAQRVLVMESGRIIRSGPIREALHA